MRGAITTLPNTPSWHDDQLKNKAQGQIYLTFLPYISELSVIQSSNKSFSSFTLSLNTVQEMDAY
jgi:hypothetical protein